MSHLLEQGLGQMLWLHQLLPCGRRKLRRRRDGLQTFISFCTARMGTSSRLIACSIDELQRKTCVVRLCSSKPNEREARREGGRDNQQTHLPGLSVKPSGVMRPIGWLAKPRALPLPSLYGTPCLPTCHDWLTAHAARGRRATPQRASL